MSRLSMRAGFEHCKYGSFHFIVQDLIDFAEDYPIEEMEVDKIPSFKASPRTERTTKARIESVDLSCPIILIVDENNVPINLGDGSHRIRKAKLPHMKDINKLPVKKIPISTSPHWTLPYFLT